MSTYERDKLNVNGDTVNLRDAGSVRFDRAQSLTAAQQAQARDNIGANDIDAYTKTQTDTLLSGKLDATQKGAAGGVAELDSGGKVPSAQLPSYVDDVVEYAGASAFPATGETGKIYVDTTDNKTYRWSGSGYVEISPSLALGETSSTAYRGDRGKAAYDHAAAKGSAFASGLYKITTNAEGHVTAAAAAAKADITALGIPGQDTTYQDATQSAAGLMSATDKAKLDGIAAGAQVNSVTGVKGGAEGSYRTGQVNLTPANIGAVSKAGDTMTGPLTVPGVTVKADQWQFYRMLDDNGVEVGHMRGDEADHRIGFREQTPETNSAFEDYLLPAPTNGNNGAFYDILTTKSPVAVNQGGTGVTGKSGAAGTDLTAGANISIRANSVVRKWGPVGVLALFFDTTGQIDAYDGLILTAASGYTPDGEYNAFLCDSSGKGYPVFFSTDGTLRPRVALPAGEYYCCNITFFTP